MQLNMAPASFIYKKSVNYSSKCTFNTFFKLSLHRLTMSHFIFNKNAFAHSNPESSCNFTAVWHIILTLSQYFSKNGEQRFFWGFCLRYEQVLGYRVELEWNEMRTECLQWWFPCLLLLRWYLRVLKNDSFKCRHQRSEVFFFTFIRYFCAEQPSTSPCQFMFPLEVTWTDPTASFTFKDYLSFFESRCR